MNQSEKLSKVIAVALIVVAALLMLDGQILGEMNSNLNRVLPIAAIPVITKGRKSGTVIDTQREKLELEPKDPELSLKPFIFELLPLIIYPALL